MNLAIKSLLPLCLILTMGVSLSDENTTSIGWSSSGEMKGLTLRQRVSDNVTLQANVGSTSFSLKDPILRSGSSLEIVNGGVSLSGLGIGGRVLYSILQEDNMNVYLGAGLGYIKHTGEIEVDLDTFKMSGGSMEYSGVAGVEFKLQGLPNLSFVTEIGISHTSTGTVDLVLTSGATAVEGSIKGSGSSTNLFVGMGAFYHF